MQAAQIKIGKEYAVLRHGGYFRYRCEAKPPKQLYARSAYITMRELDMRTGVEKSETVNVRPADVQGEWEHYQEEILARRSREAAEDQAKADNEAEIREILVEMGITEEPQGYSYDRSGGTVSLEIRPNMDRCYVTIGAKVLLAWRERNKEAR